MQLIAHGISWEVISPSYFRQPDACAEVFYGGTVWGWRIAATGDRVYPNVAFANRGEAMGYVANFGKRFGGEL